VEHHVFAARESHFLLNQHDGVLLLLDYFERLVSKSMNKQLTRGLVAVGILVLSYFAISLVSSIAQLAAFADRAIPGIAQFIFWALVIIFGGLLIAPIWIYLQLPKPLIPPNEGSDDKLAEYRAAVLEQLKKNPLLSGIPLETSENISEALVILGRSADKVVKDTASAVFVSTAVMQNGRLDGLIVLATQMRMLWRVAKVYYLRPSPRQMLYLYSNVGTNVLVADSIQEIDFAEITTPVVASILPSIKGGIPGLQGISTLLVNSMANGAANAFLTLRIGMLAKAYSEALCRPEASILRQSVNSAAMSLVAQIVKELGATIVKKSWDTVRTSVANTTEAAIGGARAAVVTTVGKTVEGARGVGNRIGDAFHYIKNR